MTDPRPPGYLALLRANPDYRRLWLGEVVSFFGDWFKVIALYTVVQQITDSAVAVSLVVVGLTLPTFLVIPIAGPIVDRFDRRTVLLVTDLVRAVLVAGLVAAHHLASLPLLYGVLVLMVGCSGIFIPARTAVIPQITRHGELAVAMALSGGTWSVMAALGAAVGGLVTHLVGVDGAFALDALSYLASFALLWGLPHLLPSGEAAPEEAGLRAGFRYLGARPYLRALLFHKPMMGITGAALAMLPIFGTAVFAVGGPLYIGILYSTRGLGALVGSMGVRRVIGDAERTMCLALVPAYGLMSLGLATVAWSPVFSLAALGYLVLMIGQGTLWVFSGTLIQHASDSAFRGRVFSLELGFMTLVTSTSSLVGGSAVDAEWAGVRGVVAVCAVLLLAPGIVWAFVLPRLWPLREAERRGHRS